MHTKLAGFLTITLFALALSPLAAANDHDKSCYDPQLIDSNINLTFPTSLKVRNGLAYIIDNNQQELVILDLSVQGFPILSRTTNFFSLNDITFNADTAYLSSGKPYSLSNNSFSVWDIADPTDPWFIRPYDTNSSPTRLTLHNDTLFQSGSLALNVARQRAPRIEQGYFPNLPGTIIHTINNTAYTHRLATLDITDPANIIELTPPLTGMFASQIISQSNIIFARSDSLITIYDHSSPTNLDRQSSIIIMGITDFVLRASILFATTPTGIQVFDVSNPNSPIQIATYTNLQGMFSPTQIELIDNTFYITDSTGTFSTFNFTTNPVATHATTGIANEIKLVNNLALLATDAGMDIFDISNPQLPTLLSTFLTNNTAVGIDAVGTIAYIATHQAGLDIVDISDPTNPTLITNFDSGRSTQDVQIIGNLAYVVDRIDGLNILDITNPASPQLISITNTPGWASDITIYQNGDQRLAIMPHERFDLQILDVTDPSAPTIISTITPLVPIPTRGINSVTVHNRLLYTGETAGGYRVFEFSNPALPVELVSINTDTPAAAGFGNNIAILGSRLLLANGSGGFSIYDNTNPLNPTLTLNHPTTGSSYRRIELRDNLAYTAVLGGGFRIIDPIGCFVPCDADFNNDGSLNFFDISAFLTAFESRDPSADLNADNRFNFFDISQFLTTFAQGCP